MPPYECPKIYRKRQESICLQENLDVIHFQKKKDNYCQTLHAIYFPVSQIIKYILSASELFIYSGSGWCDFIGFAPWILGAYKWRCEYLCKGKLEKIIYEGKGGQ